MLRQLERLKEEDLLKSEMKKEPQGDNVKKEPHMNVKNESWVKREIVRKTDLAMNVPVPGAFERV